MSCQIKNGTNGDFGGEVGVIFEVGMKNYYNHCWTITESVQALLRCNIRKILRKNNYRPDKQEKAIQTVIEQAKLLAEELV